MEIYRLPADLKVFGHLLKTFPLGIEEAFGTLMKMTDGYERSYYGLSKLDADNKVLYWPAAAERYAGEAEKYGYERFVIPAGSYLMVTILEWMKKTDSIKDIFCKMLQDERADTTTLCIEWYKSDEEMVCMLKIKE